MKTLNNKMLTRINGIRILYIETNNNLCDSIDELSASANKIKATNIDISAGVKKFIENKLSQIKEKSVDAITFGFNNYFEYVERSQLKGSTHVPKRFSRSITNILEEAFKCNQYPSDFEKSTLSELCHLSTKQITNWFTNKRNRFKNLNKKYFSFI